MSTARFALPLLMLALSAPVAACSAEAPDDEVDGTVDALTAKPWDAAAEKQFGDWVAGIGNARAAGKCTTLNACMNDGAINTLRSASDPTLNLFADCADVAMELRLYFARKTNRPFKYVSAIEGDGTDERYSKNNHPTGYTTPSTTTSLQTALSRISNAVDTGFFRMAPEIEDNDTYPIDPSPTSLRPGTVYYDPNGHLLVVYKVDADGTIWTMDGHPDNSLTFGPFTQGKYALGSRPQGGGFRNFRPQRAVNGAIQYVPNAELHDFGDSQYAHGGSNYVAWLRSQISTGPGPTPEQQLGVMLDQLCVDLRTRVDSVAQGAATAAGPLGDLPPNIYSADGDWEAYSTPSRDGRLRASFRGVHAMIAQLGTTPDAVKKLGDAWKSHVASAACSFTYTNSAGAPVKLTLADAMARIYDLSFDPYHCPEMRWGAYTSSTDEMASCSNADADHLARFVAERRNRNVIDRDPATTSTGPDYGPNVAEDIDIPNLLASLGYR